MCSGSLVVEVEVAVLLRFDLSPSRDQEVNAWENLPDDMGSGLEYSQHAGSAHGVRSAAAHG